MELNETQKLLLDAVVKALQNAYVLWGFPVGAAVLGEDGQVYVGCNIESWVSGLGVCAERAAINHAILHGNRKIREVAVVINAELEGEAVPCGMCLQAISDLAEKPQIQIVIAKADSGRVVFGSVQVKTLTELLPFPYRK